MYAYERFNGILKSSVRNRAYLEGIMVQGYYTKEDVEWALNYADLSNPIGVPKSHHEGRLVTPTFYQNKNFVQIGLHIKMHIKL
jgi:hypothetical protein